MNEDVLVKYMVGEDNTEERQSVERWLAENPENELYYRQLTAVWELSRGTSAHRDEEAAWQRFKGRLAAKQTASGAVPAIRLRWGQVAAILFVFLSVAAMIHIRYYNPPLAGFVGKDITTSDAVLHDTLTDGTVITLNKGSAIHVASAGLQRKRLVNMGAGEVFFNVARDRRRPFEVTVGNTRVQVLGTSFNIRKDGDRIEVIVSTGRVRVRHGRQTYELTAAQRLVIDGKTDTISRDEVTGELYRHYVNDRFVLKNTPLQKVIEVLAEVYGQPISIERPEVAKLTLTATFERDSLERIMDVIAETLAVTVEKKGDNWIIR